jgi:hypothetical protein
VKIYIDESGSFAIPSAGQSISLVGALVLPEVSLSKIERKYIKLRMSLPIDKGEVKGRLLSEREVAEVVKILVRNEALFEVTALNLSSDATDLLAHRAGQCEGLTKFLTPQHQPSMIDSIWKLRRRLEGISLPLYAQSLATFDIVWTTITHSTMYFSQRRPESLATFEWIVDAKASEGVTNAEDWWRSVINPMIQSRSFQEPFLQIEDGDYSHFACGESNFPDYLVSVHPKLGGTTGLTLNNAFKNIRFSSAAEYGLELVDVVTNAVRRAISGNLQQSGWGNIPQLMIHRKRPYINLISVSEGLEVSPGIRHVVKSFRNRGRNMIAPRFQTGGG